MIPQSEKLREFFESNARALIIFDGQRHDLFKEMYPDYFRGKLSEVWNGGVTWTLPWFVRHFQGKFDCTLYSANPAFSGGTGYLSKWFTTTYIPREHFKRIIPWQEIGFDYSTGTAYPKKINQVVLAKPDDKMIVHYIQPHVPYVGKPPLPWTKGGDLVNKTKSRLASGALTIKRLRKAYMGNMRLAFNGAVELEKKLEGKIVITSDHGDALGEEGHFYHGRMYPRMLCICHVPWFEVEGIK